MKKPPEGALRLQAKPAARKNAYLTAAAVCALLNLGQAYVFTPAIKDAPFAPWLTALFGTAISALFLLAVRLRKLRWPLPVGIALFGGAALAFAPRLMEGMFLLFNRTMDVLTVRTGRIFLGLSIAEEAVPHAALLFLTALSSTLIGCAAVYRDLLPAAPLLTAAAAGSLMGVLPVNAGSAALVGGGALLAFLRRTKLRKPTLRACALPDAVLALGLALCVAAVPLRLNAAPAREALSQKLHTLRFRDAAAYLPEGDFRRLPAEAPDGTPALTVTMEAPRKTYFRGYIGEIYTGARWAAPDGETLLTGRDVFFVLHRYGFYGSQVIAAANRALETQERQTVTVAVENACRRYAYVPYGCADEGLWSARVIGDTKLYAKKQTRVYTCYPEGTAAWNALLQEIAARQDETRVRQYLSDEATYREYVKDVYLQIPESTRAALEEACKQIPAPETKAQAGGAVLRLLQTRMPRRDGVEMPPEAEDFIADALARDTGGGDVHYATLAVLALRYYGIPARYAEGYLLSEEDASEMTPGAPYTLTMRHARAWAEYYVDGLGWVPFEPAGGEGDGDGGAQEGPTTEEPQSEEPQSEEPQSEEPQSEEPQSEDPQSEEPQSEEPTTEAPGTETPEEENTERTEDTEDAQRAAPVAAATFPAPPLWILILLGLLLLLLLIAAAVVLRARLTLRRKLKRLAAAPHREAVRMEYGYAELLRSLGAPVKAADAEAAKALYYEACFSTHTITEAQRRSMTDYRLKALSAGLAVWKPFTKFRLRWLRGVY